MPTPDRLAEPTLPPIPKQADEGAVVYWLHCMPCHGDRGQGLTPEFRSLYPPDHQNCWTSGCHGDRPYEAGFTIPQSVPALIGPEALTNFNSAKDLFAFMGARMPFQEPGSLKEDAYWQLTAFLLRENGVDLPASLDDTTATKVALSVEAGELLDRENATGDDVGGQETDQLSMREGLEEGKSSKEGLFMAAAAAAAIFLILTLSFVRHILQIL
jgi:hypothetical protein